MNRPYPKLKEGLERAGQAAGGIENVSGFVSICGNNAGGVAEPSDRRGQMPSLKKERSSATRWAVNAAKWRPSPMRRRVIWRG